MESALNSFGGQNITLERILSNYTTIRNNAAQNLAPQRTSLRFNTPSTTLADF